MGAAENIKKRKIIFQDHKLQKYLKPKADQLSDEEWEGREKEERRKSRERYWQKQRDEVREKYRGTTPESRSQDGHLDDKESLDDYHDDITDAIKMPKGPEKIEKLNLLQKSLERDRNNPDKKTRPRRLMASEDEDDDEGGEGEDETSRIIRRKKRMEAFEMEK